TGYVHVQIPVFGAVKAGDPDEWETYVNGSLGAGWRQSGVTGAGSLIWYLPHCPGMKVVDCRVHLNAQTGRSGLPAELPALKLIRAESPDDKGDPGVLTTISSVQLDGTLIALGQYEVRFALAVGSLF